MSTSRGGVLVAINKDVLDDLASRFLINIPDEDKDDAMRVCGHLELAHWFYLDFLRQDNMSLPACNLKEFMNTMLHHCPSIIQNHNDIDTDRLADQYRAHKHKKPVRGAIILNADLSKCLLVQGYPASTSWGFPKGKLEKGEQNLDAAVREVYEETGFDIRQLVSQESYIEVTQNDHTSRMYIIPGVPDDTHFEPKARKEIKDIQWFRVDDLPSHKKDMTPKTALGLNPNKFFLIIPFMGKLKKWISTHKSKNKTSQSRSRVRTSSSFPNSSSTNASGLSSARSSVGVVTAAPHSNTSHTRAPPQPLVVDAGSSRLLYPPHLIHNPMVPSSYEQQQQQYYTAPPKQWSSVTLAPSIALSRFSLDKRAVMKAYNFHATV